MLRARAMLAQRGQVRRRRVALVQVEAVLRPGLVQLAHEAVAGDLGEDRGGHDRTVACVAADPRFSGAGQRSAEHTSELQSLMRLSYAVLCLTKKTNN